MTDVCLVAARRTPFGRFLGALSGLGAVDLACHAGEAALEGVDRSRIDQVVLGNILGAGLGMNLARQVGVRLGLPVGSPAYTVNMMCASGMQAVALAASAIRSGEAGAVLCGGVESMSNAPHLLPRSRAGLKLGDGVLADSILRDGLHDAFDGRHMGETAEALAAAYGISREAQDAFAAASQQRCETARAAGAFDDEIAPLERLARDEHPRPETSEASLASLRPAFGRGDGPDAGGSVTAGNASGLNDGAAILLLASRERAEAEGWPVLALVERCVAVGCDPALMGLGPVHAIRRLCDELDRSLGSYDAVEINEAFAAQVLACLAELGSEPEEINSCGGAIALGHPIGASGARLVAHLAWRLHRGEIGSALASLCVGGGMGAAISLRAEG